MNLEPMLNHLWELSHDAKQYSDLVNLCQKEAINNLPQRIVFNTKEILRHLCSECLVATYHELRTEGKLNRRTREERVQLLDREYLQNKGFVQYFLNKYPVIRDAAYNTVHDYVALCTGVVRSYYDNMYTISDALGNRYGSILDISLPSGDLHNGKAVCIVTFEKGKLFYKPRDRETDQIIENFISNLILPGLPHSLSFRFPKGCQCKNNSWQEFIEYAQCDNMEQVHNFYYRAGIYLATFYVFSSCDMHYDNMISCGEYPFFFDVETLVTGRMDNDMILPKSINNSISLDDDGNTLEASEMYITLYIWPKFFSGYKIGLDFYDEANSIWEQVELTPNMEMMNTDALDDAYIDYILQLISEHQDEINELIGIAGKNIDINITQV